ncbi:hypothetical protein NQ317_018182 [Molorchus minor]|uniref:Uncharacterized protein n=1 Tax=Molorchus minor TaxID=1323400 RepID=A0ABQ9JXU3_9CUCU|nr:hypothetical protein NQ317_018182 [Molorchus minor]
MEAALGLKVRGTILAVTGVATGWVQSGSAYDIQRNISNLHQKEITLDPLIFRLNPNCICTLSKKASLRGGNWGTPDNFGNNYQQGDSERPPVTTTTAAKACTIQPTLYHELSSIVNVKVTDCAGVTLCLSAASEESAAASDLHMALHGVLSVVLDNGG